VCSSSHGANTAKNNLSPWDKQVAPIQAKQKQAKKNKTKGKKASPGTKPSSNLPSPQKKVVPTNSNGGFCNIDTNVPGDWSRLKTKADCDLAKKILYWKSLEDRKDVTFEEIANFFIQNPTWPNQIALKKKAELAITRNTDPSIQRKWFRNSPPSTPEGAVAFAKVDRTEGDRKILFDSFNKVAFDKDQLKDFVDNTQDVLNGEDFVKRFNTLMADGKVELAEPMIAYLPQNKKNLARERVTLAQGHDYVKRLNTTDAGYLWQYAHYLRKAKKDDELLKFLGEEVVQAAEVIQPALFWNERKILLRRLIEKKDYKNAYHIASKHKLEKGSDYAEAKWYEGWLNLRFLKRPKEALKDFQDVYDKSDTALFLSKAAYWAGRAADDVKDQKAREAWLQKAAKHLGTFYGQLAHSMLEEPFSKADLTISAKESKQFEALEIVRVIRLLKKVGNVDLSELFFWKLAVSVAKPDEHELVIKLASEVAGAHAAVQVTRIGAKNVMPVIDEAFPKIERASMPPMIEDHGVNIQALVHAIIRQESRFKPTATSPKGARGLMQIMDGTAHLVSRSDNIKYKSLYDVRSNIQLGYAYIRTLLRRYDGSLILAIAAYNAGPSRVDEWVKEFGYPNDPEGFEAVEWISHIPYKETRHYVERVLESYWRYWIAFKGIPINAWYKFLR